MNPNTTQLHAESEIELHALPQPVQMGKYEIAASPLPLASGRFSARVSIASQEDRAQKPHELHFRDEFPTRAAAAYFAMTHGLRWALKSLRAGQSGAFAA